jgi:hypothetical protein
LTQVQEVFGIFYSMEKIEYIKKLEEGGETYSLINLLSIPKEIEQYLNKIKSTIVYSVGDLNYPDIKINYTEKIYKTAQGFYIYLSLQGYGTPMITIYYKQEQLNEMTLFVGQLLKQFKNATINI